jgi:hypothetical protein
MPIEFNDLIAPTKGTKFQKLRPAQEAALCEYAQSTHTQPDVAIELPTGSGKTLIALLVLEFWRKKGHKVAILTGNKTLARQVEQEASLLGAPMIRFEGKGVDFRPADIRRYHRARSIAVMNYWVYINQSPSVEPADYLVLDDAQLAEGSLGSLFTLKISRTVHSELFKDAMQLISQYTDSPVAQDFVKEIEDDFTRPADLVCFPDFYEMKDEFEALVEAYLAKRVGTEDESIDLKFRWGRIRQNAIRTLCLVSKDEIELRPGCYPTQNFPHLAEPHQRIYMSATLHDPDDLRRRLGTGPISKLPIPAEVIKEEDGRRLFIFNQSAAGRTKAEAPEEVLSPLRELLNLTSKSVWMCSSASEARRWSKWIQDHFSEAGETPVVWELSPTGDEIELFKNSPKGHLFIGGRFEGMDFPGDVCRLAIFPSLPRATGLLEQFVTEQLKDAGFQRLRMLERIKQGIGRCTRGSSDYAVYYFLDPRFYIEMESAAFSLLVSEKTRQQVEVGLELTENGMGEVTPFAKKFLKGNFHEFDKREAKADVGALCPDTGRIGTGTVDDEVKGWRALFGYRDLQGACIRFEAVHNAMADAEREHRAFWKYVEAFAQFLRARLDEAPGSEERAINLLKEATKEGGTSSWFNRLAKSIHRLEGQQAPASAVDLNQVFDRWDTFVEKYPYHKGRFLKWQASLKSQLDGTHDQVCAALETLGTLLGFSSNRPSGQGVPDVLWRTPETAITIEAKIGLKRDFISRSDVDQADGQRKATIKESGLTEGKVNSLIVSRVDKVDDTAAKSIGTVRVLPLTVVEELWDRLETIMREYWKLWTRDDAADRAKARQAACKRLPPVGWISRVIRCATKPVIGAKELFKEWK